MTIARDEKGWFKKGVSGNPGGRSVRLQRIRRKLEKMDPIALRTLQELFDSEDVQVRIEALKFWGKYRLPVPRETKEEQQQRAGVPVLPAHIAARLAAMDEVQ